MPLEPMAFELHALTITLSASPSSTSHLCAAQHRAGIKAALSDLASQIAQSGLQSSVFLRGHDGMGRLCIEATPAGLAYLQSLPAVSAITPSQRTL